MKIFSTIVTWLEDRTAVGRGIRTFLEEQVPTSLGWRNTLGALAGALLLLQIVTGVLLALYYVPHPEAAFESLEWMAENVTLGGFTRALHYWGTSFIVAALFLHMLRVFVAGAYKKPREINWLTGLALLGVIMALAFTGQLLPFNQMGYWAAKVGVEIVSSAPLVGESLGRLLIGGDTVGALTLTRFYALHMIVLPALLGLFVVVHLHQLRRQGPMRPLRDTGDAAEPFFPMQFARDMLVISVALAALAAVAVIMKGPDSGPLDLTDTEYLPRPEWYFLSHFEILKWTQGEFQKVLAAFVLPNLLLAALAALPWLDRAKSNAIGERRTIVASGLFIAAGIVGLTAFGLLTAPDPHQEADATVAEESEEETDGDPDRARLAAGRRVYRELKCQTCHRIDGRGEIKAPDLSGVGLRLQEPYLRNWLRNPPAFIPDIAMPPVTVTDEKFDALVAYLMSLDAQPEL